MILKLTYHQKLKLLPFSFIIVTIIIYWIALSGTFKLKKECKELKDQMISAGDASAELASLTARLNELGLKTGDNEQDVKSDPLLNFISTYSISSPKLVNYLPLHLFKKNPYLIETRIAVFEGSYADLIIFLFSLEKKYNLGKVVSAKFETETNLKSGKKRLLMTLYIQSISDDKDQNANDKNNSRT
jgi:hypothetical protein